MQDAGGDQQFTIGRQADEQGGEGKQSEAQLKDALAAVEIPHATTEEKQGAERQDVAIDNPRQVGSREGQLVLDSGQGDVRDGVVQDQHQLGGGDHEQGETKAVGRVWGGLEILGHDVFLAQRLSGLSGNEGLSRDGDRLHGRLEAAQP